MATQRPWSNRSSRCAREIRGCATRTSARRSRPTTTSCPAANVRSDPSYRTVNTGGAAGWLIGTNCIGTAADAGAGAPGQASRPSRPAVASANLLATFPSGLAGLLHAHSNRRFLLDGQRRLRRVSSGGHSRTGHGVLGQRPDGGVGALQRRAVGRRPGLGGAGAAEREAEGADGDNRSGRRCSRGVGGASRGRGRGGRARCARGGYRSGRAGRCGGPRPRRLRCTLVVSTLELPQYYSP